MTEHTQIDHHWFITEEESSNDFAKHNVDAFGYHANFCNGRGWEHTGLVTICCGKTPCFYCGTPMHGCTDNGFEISSGIKYHQFCRLLVKINYN